MANYISQIKLPDNSTYDIKDARVSNIFSGLCSSLASAETKVVNCPSFTNDELQTGAVVFVTFNTTNSAAVGNLKLQVGNSTVKPIKHLYNGTIQNIPEVSYLAANQTYPFYYDGTNWVVWMEYDTDTTYEYTGIFSDTDSTTPNKIGTTSSYTLQKGHFSFWLKNSNTSQAKLTLSIKNGDTAGTAKDIWLNGAVTSSSNYNWPAGYYIGYYDGNCYHFRTDGKLSGDITGDAATVNGLTVQTAVPANALFTDTNSYHTTGSWDDLTYTATSVNNAGQLQFTIPTGTTATTVALGNHTHSYAGSSSVGGAATSAESITVTLLTTENLNTIFPEELTVYSAAANNTVTNGPTGTADGFSLLIFKNSETTTVQYLTLKNGKHYQRVHNGTSWGNWELVFGASCATADSYGNSSNQTPAFGSTFKVPYLTVDSYGRITDISDYTVKIPDLGNVGTHYTFSSGDANGQIKVTPDDDTAYNVSVTGLKSAAYTESSAYAAATHDHDDAYLQLTGGTLTGAVTTKGLIGTLNYDYGPTLPANPTTGQLFFQYSDSSYELPDGGNVGQALVKNSSADYDVVWGDVGGIMTPNNVSTYYVTGSTSLVRNTDPAVFNSNIYVADNVLFGAAWNDYAEYRETKEKIEPGRCVVEVGDGTLTLSTQRMQAGAEIVSDTFGFAIGKTEKSTLPIAISGRVLAYIDGPLEKFKPGAPVCSGPNGTVSCMTKREARKYPWLIIGTVSSIPSEKTWGANNVPVNGRIWIRVR